MNIIQSIVFILAGFIAAPFSFIFTQPPTPDEPITTVEQTVSNTPVDASTTVVAPPSSTKTDAVAQTNAPSPVFSLRVNIRSNTVATTSTRIVVVPTPVLTTTGDSTSTQPVGGASITPMPELTCSLSAELVTWPQGTKHAKFTWAFTEGAVGKITQDSNPNSPQSEVRFIPGPNTHAVGALDHDSITMEDVYSGTITGPETFTLTVSKDGHQTVTCKTTVSFPQ